MRNMAKILRKFVDKRECVVCRSLHGEVFDDEFSDVVVSDNRFYKNLNMSVADS